MAPTRNHPSAASRTSAARSQAADSGLMLVHAAIRGEDQCECPSAQQRRQEERNAPRSRGEEQAHETDVCRGDRLNEVERAAEPERDPHDDAGDAEKNEEPRAPRGASAENPRDECAEKQEQSGIGEDFLEMGLLLHPDGVPGGDDVERPEQDRVDAQVRGFASPERPEADGHSTPRGERREREPEDRPRVPPICGDQVDEADDEEMMRPARSEQREVGLDVRKIRREHQEAQQENVVERDARRTDLAPRKRRRLARDPDQASGRRGADGGSYGPRPDLPMELRDDETNARGEEEDADVEEDSNLEPHRDELSAGHAIRSEEHTS